MHNAKVLPQFYAEFRKKLQNSFPYAMGFKSASDLILLLKYLSGRLPVSDFEIDFGIKLADEAISH
ncbi:MAG: hypothetical protein U9R02_15030 [Thermodesulfobacteriota bacterium]|nr:hypothetical protein [Thermodesulfobacteriota bacterium]